MAALANNSSGNNSDFAFIYGLGLVDNTASATAPLTRIELARILYNIIFGDTELHTDYYKDYQFTDVAENDKNVVAIMMDAGIMKGDGYGRFMPDATVTYNQLIKTVIAFLGYDYKAQTVGGYPSGYMILASQMQILLPWAVDGDAHVTYAAAASVLKRALDTPMCVINDTVYEILEDENWLYHYMNIKTDYGIISGNYLANLYSDTISGYDKIDFNGKTMEISDNCIDIHDMLGMNVRIYFVDDAIMPKIVYFEKGLNTAYTVNDMEIGYATLQKVVKYEGETDITYTISADAEMIYNGSHLATFTAEDINPFEAKGLNGEIKLIDNNNDTLIDYIVVSAYETMLVGSVSDGIIYDFYGKKAPVSIENYKERNIDICNILGEPILPEKIAAGVCANILRDKQNNITKIAVTNDNLNGVLDEIAYSGSKMSAISMLGSELRVANNVFVNTNGFDPAPGNGAKVYFDILGKVAIIDLVNYEGGEKSKFAVAVDGGAIGALESKSILRLFTEDGEMKDYEISERVKINGVTATDAQSLLSALGSTARSKITRQVLIYKAENEILTEVILPTEPGTFNDSFYEFSSTGLKYIAGLSNYGSKFTLSKDMKVFRMPADSQRNIQKFYSVSSTIPNGSFSSTRLFGTNKLGLEATVVVVTDNTRGNVETPPSVIDREPIFMIEKITESLDDDGEKIFKISCHTVNGYYYYKMFFYTKPDVLLAGCGGKYPEAGDILRSAHFYNNGEEVNWVKLLYDFSEDKPGVSIPYNSLGDQEYYTYGTVVAKSGTTVKIKTYTAPGAPDLNNFEVHNIGGSFYKILELKESKRGELTIANSTPSCILDETTSPGKGSEIFMYTRADGGFAVFVINRK